jgi:hypothetical protein
MAAHPASGTTTTLTRSPTASLQAHHEGHRAGTGGRPRALGEAVIRIWSNLPQDVQLHLFQEAVTSHGESIRTQLAVFLHDKHPRTSDPLGNPREMTEPVGVSAISRRVSLAICNAHEGRASVVTK